MSNKTSQRYSTSGLLEAEHEPGSEGRVLKNLLGIKKKRQIDLIEYKELLRALSDLSRNFRVDHVFTAKDICLMHKVWLSGIYGWAGQYRNVNMTKDGFTFAGAHAIPQLMVSLEKDHLKRFTPCRGKNLEDVIEALAVIHAELVLIHPFREGNGRLARLLSVLMGLQAQLPPLDFSGLAERKRTEYFAAVRAALDKNYAPMQKIFSSVIRRTLKEVRK